jgi:hypothetical protein
MDQDELFLKNGVKIYFWTVPLRQDEQNQLISNTLKTFKQAWFTLHAYFQTRYPYVNVNCLTYQISSLSLIQANSVIKHVYI